MLLSNKFLTSRIITIYSNINEIFHIYFRQFVRDGISLHSKDMEISVTQKTQAIHMNKFAVHFSKFEFYTRNAIRDLT